MRAACLIEEVQRLLDRQSGLYSVYADAIQKYKQSKDATAFANARKKLDGDYRAISNQISQVQASLSKEQPEAAEKVRAKLSVPSDTKPLAHSCMQRHQVKAWVFFQIFHPCLDLISLCDLT